MQTGFPLDVPRAYTRGLEARQSKLESLQHSVMDALSKSGSGGSSNPSEAAASSAVSRKFLEWVLRSGRAQHLVDLIRLDRESFANAAAADLGGGEATVESSESKYEVRPGATRGDIKL